MLVTVSPTYAREIQTGDSAAGSTASSGSRAPTCSASSTASTSTSGTPRPTPTSRRFTPRTGAARRPARRRSSGSGPAGEPRGAAVRAVGRLTDQKGFDVLAHAFIACLLDGTAVGVLGTGDREPSSSRVLAAPATASSVARLRRRARAPHRGRRRLLPHAVPVRALRAQPAVQPALRDAARRARHRRPGRHGRSNYVEATGEGTGFVLGDLSTPDSLHDIIGGGALDLVRPPRARRRDAPARHGPRLFLGRVRGRLRAPLPRRLPAPEGTRLPGLGARARRGLPR